VLQNKFGDLLGYKNCTSSSSRKLETSLEKRKASYLAKESL